MEASNILGRSWNGLTVDGLNFARVKSNTFSGDDTSQKIHFIGQERTFLQVGIEFLLPKSLKYLL